MNGRQIKFRVWDGERMHLPAESPWWQLTAEGQPWHRQGQEEPDAVLMQYTGLIDAEGEEIFEGDILGLPGAPQGAGPVVFKNGAWCVDRGDGSLPWYFNSKSHREIILDALVVKGNLFENPELMDYDDA